MATAVTIQITVDSAQANAAMAALTKSMQETGVNADTAFKRAGSGAQQMTGHVTTGLDAVRLLSQEFGLRLPRAMEAMLSRIPAVTGALSGMIGALAGVAAVEVFGHMADDLVKVYNKMFDINAAMREFAATAGKAANEKLFDEASLETSLGLLREANSQIAMLEQKRQAIEGDKKGAGFFQYLRPGYGGGYGGGYTGGAFGNNDLQSPKQIDTFTTADDEREAYNAKIAAQETLRTHQQKREFALEELKNSQEANEQTLHGIALFKQQLQDAKDLNALKRLGTREQEQDLHDLTVAAQHLQVVMHVDSRDKDFVQIHNVDPNAGAEAERVANKKAQQEYDAKVKNLNRETGLAVMKSDDELAESRLSDFEQFLRKREDIAKEFNARLNAEGHPEEAPAAIAAAQQKLDDETYQKDMEHVRALHQAREEDAISGLKGGARIVGDRDLAVDKINSDPRYAGKPEEAAAQRAAVNAEMYRKLADLDDAYTRSNIEETDARTAAAMGAIQKIDAAEEKALKDKQAKYDETYAGTPLDTPAARAGLQASKNAISADYQAQRNKLTEQNNATDLQYTQEAERAEARVREDGFAGWIAQYRNTVQEIEELEKEHIAKMREQAIKDGQADQIGAREVAIVRESNAQIEQLNQQMQHQIAGTLQEAFTNPVDFIKSAMEKMFFEIVASWIMRMKAFQSLFGTTMGGTQPGGGGAAIGGSTTVQGAVRNVLGLGGGAVSAGGSGTASQIANATSSTSSGNPSFGAAGVSSTIGSVSSVAQSFGIGGGGSTAGSGSYDFNGPMTGDTPDNPAAPSWLSQNGGGLLAAGAGAYNAYSGLVNAFKTGNPLTGAMADGAEGAAIGSIVPGVGTAIGAAAGAVVGAASGLAGDFTGMGGNLSARDYYNKQVFPQLNNMMAHPDGDFQTEISAANQLAANALNYMGQHYGMNAANWVNDNYMKKELQKVTQLISDTAEGGRQFTQRNAMQFHSGGTITGFGDYATSYNEGMIHAQLGETVMTPGASATHGAMLAAMNAGASASDIAGRYLAGTGAGGMSAQSASGGDTHFHVHTLDTRTMQGWLKTGGAQMINKHLNDYNAQYAGDGVAG